MSKAMMRLRGIAAGLAAVIVTAACAPYATPGPTSFTYSNVRTVLFDSIRAYANGLQFDSVPYAADVRHVKFDSLGRARANPSGDSATIEPEVGAWAIKLSDLAEGRIIARVKTDSVHLPIGYSRRWTWWWIDKHGPPGDSTWRSVLLSDSLETRVQDSVLTIATHPGHYWRQSLARWGSLWGTCSRSACCIKE